MLPTPCPYRMTNILHSPLRLSKIIRWGVKITRDSSIVRIRLLRAGLAANERQHLVAFLIHERGGSGFQVHAQQGFGVGGAHVEPPVAEIEGDAVKMIDGLRLRTEIGRASCRERV